MAPPAEVGFSDLPAEALNEIARRAGPLDNVICSAVCRPWRRALKTIRLRPLGRHANWPHEIRLGWSSTVEVSPIYHDSACSIRTAVKAVRSGTRIIGCSYGWVITADDESRVISLLDPLTGRRFLLPPIASSGRDIRKHEEVKRELRSKHRPMYHKAALAPGRRLGTYAVMLIHSDGRGLSFLRPGAESWTTLRPPRGMPHKYVDAIFHKGAFYTVSCYAEVNAWVPEGGGGLRTKCFTHPQREHVWAVLVESMSRDDLLPVMSSKEKWIYCQRHHYEVSCCDQREHRLIPVKDLGESAILVGSCCSFCVSTRGSHDAPRRNHLYFASGITSNSYDYGNPGEYRLPVVMESFSYGVISASNWYLHYVA